VLIFQGRSVLYCTDLTSFQDKTRFLVFLGARVKGISLQSYIFQSMRVLCSTVLYSTVLSSTLALYSTLRYSTVLVSEHCF